MFPAIVLNRRIAALERVFVTQPLKNPFGSVPLLAVPAEIFLRQRVDKASEAIALWPLDLNRLLITGWCRTQHHLRHARTQYPKMTHCRPFTHAAPTCEADLFVKVYAEITPALRANTKGQSGKVLLCPQQDTPATSVAHFCIAVLMLGRIGKGHVL